MNPKGLSFLRFFAIILGSGVFELLFE